MVGNSVLATIHDWMCGNGLQVSPAKSEAVLLTKKRSYREPVFVIAGSVIPVKPSIKYLGVHLDTRLSFNEHLVRVSAAARNTTAALGRLMPNVSGPSTSRR